MSLILLASGLIACCFRQPWRGKFDVIVVCLLCCAGDDEVLRCAGPELHVHQQHRGHSEHLWHWGCQQGHYQGSGAIVFLFWMRHWYLCRPDLCFVLDCHTHAPAITSSHCMQRQGGESDSSLMISGLLPRLMGETVLTCTDFLHLCYSHDTDMHAHKRERERVVSLFF